MRRLLIAFFVAACTTPVTVPSPSPGGTAAPSATAAPLTPDFERLTFPAPDGSALTGVTAGGPRFVAVGFDGGSRAIVRISDDGRAWTAVDSPAFDGAVMIGVAHLSGQLVALGRDVTDIERDLAAVWLSVDGRVWRRVSTVPAFEGAQLLAAVRGGPGIVAVGGQPRMDRAGVWNSANGEAWDRVAAFDNAFLWSIAAGGPGFVAAGWRRAPEIMAAVWTSRDGRSWTLASALPAGRNFQVRTVASLGGTLVAAGDGLGGEGAGIWTSADGIVWTHIATFPGSTITSLIPTEGGLVAVGGRGDAAAVWVSPDGRAWASVTSDAFTGAYMTAGAADRRGIVAVGATQQPIAGTGSYDQRAAAWISPVR